MAHDSRADARQVLDSVRRITRGLRLWARASEKETGLGGAQLYVLQHLSEHEPISINDRAERMLMDQSTVSVLVTRLAKRGLVVRDVSRNDARKAAVSLTEEGRKILARAPRSAQERMIRAVLALPPEESRRLALLLDRFVRDAGFYTEEPGLIFEEQDEGKRKRKKRRIGN